MSTRKWLDVPVVEVEIKGLVATQPGVWLHALSSTAPAPVGGDQYPHVIHWKDIMYLEDGHHRVVKAALQGQTHVLARVLYIY